MRSIKVLMNSFFEIIRAGINTTFQDNGRANLHHIGIPFSGAMDKRNYRLANCIVGNKVDDPVIEFAYQGPLIKYRGDKISLVITGDVIFKLIKKENEIQGNCYENYFIDDGYFEQKRELWVWPEWYVENNLLCVKMRSDEIRIALDVEQNFFDCILEMGIDPETFELDQIRDEKEALSKYGSSASGASLGDILGSVLDKKNNDNA